MVFSADLSKKKFYEIDDTLSQNVSWELFLKEFSFKKLYLVFAGPYPSSPTSSFGHIFILLEPKEKLPFLLWKSIDFSATIEDVGSFEFFVKGIFGGLVGEYRTVPFFEKFREYTFIESRPLWLFPVNFNDGEKKNFLLNLFHLQKQSFPYRFTDRNCASQIDSLLQISSRNPATSDRAVFFPKTIIDNWKNRLDEPMFIESMNNIIYENINKLSTNVSNRNFELKELSDSEIVLLLNVLEWKYVHEQNHLSNEEIKFLEELRVIVSKSQNNTINHLKTYNKEFNIHPSMLFGAGYNIFSNVKPEYTLQGRFGLHEYFENTDVYPANDYLSLFKIEIGLKKNGIFINKLLLFNQLSLQPISFLSKYISWKIGFGIDRKLEYSNMPIASGLFSGIGYTIPLFKNNFNLSLLMDVSPVYLQNYGLSALFGPEFILNINLSNKMKLMNNFTVIFNTNKKLENIFKNEINFGYTFSKSMTFLFQFTQTRKESWYSIKVNHYIN